MISVCVPYWDRPDELTEMIGMYMDMYADLDWEIVVAEDGQRYPLAPVGRCRFVTLPAKTCPLNPCVPINAAVRAALGDVIVLTNPEVRHPEPILAELVGMLDGPDDYVSVPCYDVDRRMWVAGPGARYLEPLPPRAHFHFLAACRRTLWDKAGGFDERYRYGQGYDDADWLWRLDAVGATFKCLTDVRVTHTHSRTQWGLPSNRELYHQIRAVT